MDAIALNSTASQRDLSRETGLNLAKVNFLLRRLAEKGFVKLRNGQRNPNKLGYLYILTPRGLSEKSRLTVRFAARTWREYSRTIERLRESLARLVGSGGRRVLLLGASEVVDMVFEAGTDIDGLEIIGIIDPTRNGEKRRGIPIMAAIDGIEFDWAVPCDHAESSPSELAKKAGIEEEKLWLV